MAEQPTENPSDSGADVLNEVDAVPGRFEEPFAGRPESLPMIGGAASHLGGLALCGSGSASGFKVARPPRERNPSASISPHVPQKKLRPIDDGPPSTQIASVRDACGTLGARTRQRAGR